MTTQKEALEEVDELLEFMNYDFIRSGIGPANARVAVDRLNKIREFVTDSIFCQCD